MRIADRKEADDVIALVRAIEPAGRAGIALPAIAARVSIAPKRVKRLLRRHSEYFVQIADEPKFALNRFRKFRGSAELIIADIERSHGRFARLQLAGLVLMLLAILLTAGSNLFFD